MSANRIIYVNWDGLRSENYNSFILIRASKNSQLLSYKMNIKTEQEIPEGHLIAQ